MKKILITTSTLLATVSTALPNTTTPLSTIQTRATATPCKSQKRFTRAMKKRIDDYFKSDVYKYCSRLVLSSWKGIECRWLTDADTCHAAVHKFGKRKELNQVDFEKQDGTDTVYSLICSDLALNIQKSLRHLTK